MRLLHLADLHLGWQPSGWPLERALERRRRRDAVLERAVDLALAEGVALVVLAGDLFDAHDPDEPTVEAALEQLRRLEGAGVLTLTVPGRHDDAAYASSVYRQRRDAWPGLLVTEPVPAHIASVTLAGQSVHLYGMAAGDVELPVREFPRLERPGIHVATFHAALGTGAGAPRAPSLDAEALAAARYHYVALGSLHEPLRHRFPAGPAVYPGAAAAMAFGDGGCGTVTLAEWDGEALQPSEVAVPVQAVRESRLDLTPIDDVLEVDARIRELADPEAVHRIRLVGASWLPELDLGALEERHRDAFFHLELVDAVDGLARELLGRWAEEASVRGAFVARLLERLEGADAGERPRLERSLRWGVAALADGPSPGGPEPGSPVPGGPEPGGPERGPGAAP